MHADIFVAILKTSLPEQSLEYIVTLQKSHQKFLPVTKENLLNILKISVQMFYNTVVIIIMYYGYNSKNWKKKRKHDVKMQYNFHNHTIVTVINEFLVSRFSINALKFWQISLNDGYNFVW